MIDTHAHLHLINRNTEDVLAAAKEAGVYHVVQVAIDLPSIHRNLNEYALMPNCSITGGIHPLSVSDSLELDEVLSVLNAHVDAFVAIGEIGLDYHWHPDQKEAQHTCLIRQLEWAREQQLPVIIHNRKADEDIISITNQYPDVTMVFHCFCSSEVFVERTIRENRYYSVTGLITYAKKGKTIRALQQIPIEQLMLETDCPYLSPKQHQEEDNEPAFIPEIAEKLAEIKRVSVQEIATMTTRNARRFFNIQA